MTLPRAVHSLHPLFAASRQTDARQGTHDTPAGANSEAAMMAADDREQPDRAAAGSAAAGNAAEQAALRASAETSTSGRSAASSSPAGHSHELPGAFVVFADGSVSLDATLSRWRKSCYVHGEVDPLTV